MHSEFDAQISPLAIRDEGCYLRPVGADQVEGLEKFGMVSRCAPRKKA